MAGWLIGWMDGYMVSLSSGVLPNDDDDDDVTGWYKFSVESRPAAYSSRVKVLKGLPKGFLSSSSFEPPNLARPPQVVDLAT